MILGTYESRSLAPGLAIKCELLVYYDTDLAIRISNLVQSLICY